jgi:hypothetical protein
MKLQSRHSAGGERHFDVTQKKNGTQFQCNLAVKKALELKVAFGDNYSQTIITTRTILTIYFTIGLYTKG